MTIEGYRETDRFAVLDKAYASVSAVQCGFCIPGMVLAPECILAKIPSQSEEENRDGFSGNSCRGTGNNECVEEIGIATKEGKGLG